MTPVRSAGLVKGIGDDAAVIRPRGAGEYWVITTDMLVEEVDFRLNWTSARRLGARSLAVNLSDLAAVGARPRFFTISLALPAGIPERWILEFHKGAVEKGAAHGAALIGGDLSRAERIAVSIAAFGESLNRKILYRSGGKAGDILYVTGELGRSAAGLKLLLDGNADTASLPRKKAIRAHLDPEPRCRAGIWLAQSGLVSCMMDLSDGLSTDLPRLCTPGNLGAEILRVRLPVFSACANWGCDPLDLALNGGEDFELLFAVPARKASLLEKKYPKRLPPISRIGRLTTEPGKIWILSAGGRRDPLPPRGYDHFSHGF